MSEGDLERGWYLDPSDPTQQRYWDGAKWTRTRPVPDQAAAAEETAPEAGPAAAAGWYPDPTQPATVRYWDGAAWTEQRAPAQQPAAATPRTTAAEPAESKGGCGTVVALGVLAAIVIVVGASLLDSGGGDGGGDGGGGGPSTPQPPFTKAKIEGKCPGFLAVGIPVTVKSRITNTGSEDWPATYVATDDFDSFVVNGVTLDGEVGRNLGTPGYDSYRFRGLDAGETAELSLNLTPKDAGNSDLQMSIWGDRPGGGLAAGIPEGNALYGCTDLAIQP